VDELHKPGFPGAAVGWVRRARAHHVRQGLTARPRSHLEVGLADSVRGMMWMIDGVDLLVSHDTGPLHLAHALGTPVAGLLGHTNPAWIGPWRRYLDLMVDRYTEAGAPPDPTHDDPQPGREWITSSRW
jgi:ADP-heptose:LPS heptosyltransferase